MRNEAGPRRKRRRSDLENPAEFVRGQVGSFHQQLQVDPGHVVRVDLFDLSENSVRTPLA